MNKSSIRKLMATSVLTAVITMSNMQFVSAQGINRSTCEVKPTTSVTSKYKINWSKINANFDKNKPNYGTEVKKTSNGNTDCEKTNSNKNTNTNTNTNTNKNTNTNTNKNTDKNTNTNTNTNGNTNSQTETTNTNSSISAFEQEVITLVNAERAKANLPALKANQELSKVARVKSQDMIDKNYFSHTSPTYGSPFDMMKKFGIKYSAAGENIAYGQPTPKAVVDGWMNSPGHRANILSKSFTEIGVGVAKKSNGTYYWTQMFINPAK
ncbi:serine protease [Clostridium sp. MSJ-11]|uniref:Serine protease n=1 Tax=Clostridium mobile TaxID=2841512 RepID=A0ABS6EFS0_9CLOT|nr:CAP domain-containing protein [Clostridium mobile]MBU5484035.1 serine protease [Clostridium mobile]